MRQGCVYSIHEQFGVRVEVQDCGVLCGGMLVSSLIFLRMIPSFVGQECGGYVEEFTVFTSMV